MAGESIDKDTARDFVTRLGVAMIAASTPTPTVEATIARLAEQYRIDVSKAILPTGILTVSDTGRGSSLALTSPGSYRFDQTQELFTLIEQSLDGSVTPEAGLRRLGAINSMPAAFTDGWRYVGYLLVILGLCLRQNPGTAELTATAAIGVVVAGLLVLMPRAGSFKALVPALAAFVAGLPVALLVQHGDLTLPWQVIVPLMAAFIPGAALTIGSLELCRGALAAGTERLASGVHQLFVLAFGLALAIAAIEPSLPASAQASPQVGAWAPVVGVGLYGVGSWLAFSAPRAALAGLLVVIYAAWGTQQLVDGVAGGYAASFAGAVVAVLVALAAYRMFDSSPSPLLTLNPLFRILAPGGLGLVGVTTIASGGSFGSDLGIVLFTFLSVAIGLVTGVSLADSLRRRPRLA